MDGTRRFSNLGVMVSFAMALSACNGTADGGIGDPRHKPRVDELGGEQIHEVLGPATWLDPENQTSEGCSSPAERGVSVTGVTIVAIDRFDETGDGQGNYYVEDTSVEPVEYSGVTVFGPSFSPPDLRLAEGDVVDFDGALQEFLGPSSSAFGQCRTLPELSGTLSFRLENGTRIPKEISLDELKNYESARKWLGMLVKVTPREGTTAVTIGDNPGGSKGRYQAPFDVGVGVKQSDVPMLTNELYDLKQVGPPITAGSQFKSITGIVTYFYGFHVAPRSKDDFELP